MLSKDFLLEHFTETISNKLKHQVSEESTCRKRVREIVVLADYSFPRPLNYTRMRARRKIRLACETSLIRTRRYTCHTNCGIHPASNKNHLIYGKRSFHPLANPMRITRVEARARRRPAAQLVRDPRIYIYCTSDGRS